MHSNTVTVCLLALGLAALATTVCLSGRQIMRRQLKRKRPQTDCHIHGWKKTRFLGGKGVMFYFIFLGFGVRMRTGHKVKSQKEHPIHHSPCHIVFVQCATSRQNSKFAIKYDIKYDMNCKLHN